MWCLEEAIEVSDMILLVSTTYDSSACVLLVSVFLWYHVHK